MGNVNIKGIVELASDDLYSTSDSDVPSFRPRRQKLSPKRSPLPDCDEQNEMGGDDTISQNMSSRFSYESETVASESQESLDFVPFEMSSSTANTNDLNDTITSSDDRNDSSTTITIPTTDSDNATLLSQLDDKVAEKGAMSLFNADDIALSEPYNNETILSTCVVEKSSSNILPQTSEQVSESYDNNFSDHSNELTELQNVPIDDLFREEIIFCNSADKQMELDAECGVYLRRDIAQETITENMMPDALMSVSKSGILKSKMDSDEGSSSPRHCR